MASKANTFTEVEVSEEPRGRKAAPNPYADHADALVERKGKTGTTGKPLGITFPPLKDGDGKAHDDKFVVRKIRQAIGDRATPFIQWDAEAGTFTAYAVEKIRRVRKAK